MAYLKLNSSSLDPYMLLDNFVKDDDLHDFINTEENIHKLYYYLEWKWRRIERNLSQKTDFSISKLLFCDKDFGNIREVALKLALSIQDTDDQFIICLNYFNKKLEEFILSEECTPMKDLYSIATVIIDVHQTLNTNIFDHIQLNKLKMLLFKITDIPLNNEVMFNVPATFLKYFDAILPVYPQFIDEILTYLMENENINFLSILFYERIDLLAKCPYFQNNELWRFIKSYLIQGIGVDRKQASYILMKSIDFLEMNDFQSIPQVLRAESFQDWNYYFLLLEMSKEKQLHLVKPTLKLLPSIQKLHSMWRISLFKAFLNHSQLHVLYKTVEYLLNGELDLDHNEELLIDILDALNKFEYSQLSRKVFESLSIHCGKFGKEGREMVIQAFMTIEWNPASAWCTTKSLIHILQEIPVSLMSKIISILKMLPHTFIKNSCTYFLLLNKINCEMDNFLENIKYIGLSLLFSGSEADIEVFKLLIHTNRECLLSKTSELKREILASIEVGNEKDLYTYLEVINVSNISVELNIVIPYTNIGDIILLQTPNEFKSLKIRDYLMNRMKQMNNEQSLYLSQFLITIFNDKRKLAIVGINNKECLDILNACRSSFTEIVEPSAMYLCEYESVPFEIFEANLSSTDLLLNTNICISVLKIFQYYLEIKVEDHILQKLLVYLHGMLDSENEEIFLLVIDYLEFLGNFHNRKISDIIIIYDECLTKICQLSNAILRLYAIKFFKALFDYNLFSYLEFIEQFKCWMNSFECHFLDNNIILKVILEGCKKLIILKALNLDVLTPLILIALQSGTVIQKNQRVEYGICEDIHQTIGTFSPIIQNPNIISMEVRMIAIECLYLLGRSDSINETMASVSDDLIDFLISLYMKHFGTRYFPNSKIHVEKLRIVQAMLVLVRFVVKSKERLTLFILKSFSEESHQPSVRQLLQWLLIMLVSNNPAEYMDMLIRGVHKSNLCHPSSVVALIPVLYHLVYSSKDSSIWYKVTDALLPWTMGANFKLRVYCQVVLSRLIDKAEEKEMSHYLNRYSFLKQSISDVLEATGSTIEATLKNDLTFIESFDPHLHYTIKNIFIILPEMLNVPESEWANIREYKFSDQFDLDIDNGHFLPNNLKISKDEVEENDFEISGMNIQKKIIPWKESLNSYREYKTLGDLICVASLLEKPSNIGGLSRTCEIFSIRQLVVHNAKMRDDKEFKNLSMSSENWVEIVEVKKEDLFSYLSDMKKLGYSLVGLEQTAESVKINECRFDKKTLLLLGNEKEGIFAPLLPLLDSCVEIPQFGQTRSLNVHVASAICIWEYAKQQFL